MPELQTRKDRAFVLDAVRAIVADQLEVPLEKITEASRLGDDLGADSLSEVEIAMEVEERFDLAIPDDAMARNPSVGEVVELVLAHLA